MIYDAPQHPDRLVVFLHELVDKALRLEPLDGDASVKDLVDGAVEANLTEPLLVVPAGFDTEYDPLDHDGELQGGEYAYRLHQWAFALTGVTAKGRAAVSQLGLSDGEQRGWDGVVQPDRIADVVAEVSDRIAREGA